MARDVKLDKIIGFAFNKIQVIAVYNERRFVISNEFSLLRSNLIPTKSQSILQTESKILKAKMAKLCFKL